MTIFYNIFVAKISANDHNNLNSFANELTLPVSAIMLCASSKGADKP
ncbi:MAG: hypothetical protein GQF41_4076 [Candidatus Rifleibacterium amylolyticum]|nr:MAG: hypothetical protein GQF41_4076 [Candidatus Rifleibacterium amylolyticum]